MLETNVLPYYEIMNSDVMGSGYQDGHLIWYTLFVNQDCNSV